jgi:predicted nucleic acid-binding protein
MCLLLKGNEKIENNALSVGLDNLSISFINLSELYYGAYKSERQKENLEAIQKMLERINIIDSSDEVCRLFGGLKAKLGKDGKIIDDADLFIAACAIEHELIFVTNNEKHFSRVAGLKLVN